MEVLYNGLGTHIVYVPPSDLVVYLKVGDFTQLVPLGY